MTRPLLTACVVRFEKLSSLPDFGFTKAWAAVQLALTLAQLLLT